MNQSLGRAQAVLIPALIAFAMGQTVLFAVAGPVARDIGLSEFQFGTIIASAAAVFVVASPIWGRISDSWGRKRTIVFGLTSYGIVSVLFAAAMQAGLNGLTAALATFFILLGLRVTYAALGAGIQPSATALMADLSSPEKRTAAIAMVGASFGIGSILGPAAAAGLVGFGVLAPLYVIASLGLMMALICAFALQEPNRTDAGSKSQGDLSLLKLLPLLMIGFALFTVVASLQQTVAFYVQDSLGLDTKTAAQFTGYCFMALAVATLLVQGGLIQALKPSPRILLLTGFPIFLVGLLIYAAPTSIWQIVAGMAVMGMGFGLINPGITAAVSLRTSEDAQGQAAGFVQSAASIGYIIGPLAATGLYQMSPTYTIYFAGSILVLGFTLSLPIAYKATQNS